jgi:F-type H+-transporting ATPase subunit b
LHLDALVYQTIILIVILYVLNKFLFQPYLQYLDEYSKKQKKIEEDYKNIDKLVADAESEKKSILEEARKTGDTIISEAESIAAKKKSAIMDKADKEASDLLDASKADIEKERQSMLSQVK